MSDWNKNNAQHQNWLTRHVLMCYSSVAYFIMTGTTNPLLLPPRRLFQPQCSYVQQAPPTWWSSAHTALSHPAPLLTQAPRTLPGILHPPKALPPTAPGAAHPHRLRPSAAQAPPTHLGPCCPRLHPPTQVPPTRPPTQAPPTHPGPAHPPTCCLRPRLPAACPSWRAASSAAVWGPRPRPRPPRRRRSSPAAAGPPRCGTPPADTWATRSRRGSASPSTRWPRSAPSSLPTVTRTVTQPSPSHARRHTTVTVTQPSCDPVTQPSCLNRLNNNT